MFQKMINIMSIKNRITDFFAPEVDDEEEYLEVNEEEAKSISKYEKPKARGVSAAETNIVMFEPRSFDEVVDILNNGIIIYIFAPFLEYMQDYSV